MKRWWLGIVNDYFTFTKRERVATIGIVIIGILIYFLPELLSPKQKPIADADFAKEISRIRITVDTASSYRRFADDGEDNHLLYKPNTNIYTKKKRGELFNFDPNTLDKSGWERLGLREKTIQTIANFRDKGYRFRQPEDIRKIYGIHNDEAERLIPYIHIQPQPALLGSTPSLKKVSFPEKKGTDYKPDIIDINKADTADFILLKGIGNKLATRIVNFREKLGGFVSVKQISETYGLPDSTFETIRPLLKCEEAEVHKIDINSADANQLKSHPYIKWNIANAIISYREQHGKYNSPEELKKINIISDDLYQKIAPYVALHK